MENGSKILDKLMETIPLLCQLAEGDQYFALFSRTHVLGVWKTEGISSEFFQKGAALDTSNKKYQFILEAMEQGVASEKDVPEEIFGILVKENLVPVFEDGQVVGLIVNMISRQENARMEALTETLDNNLVQSLSSIEEIANGVSGLSDKLNTIHTTSEMVRGQADRASKLVNAIQGNASRSNILALNASIEAARAGEAGRGFAVVANEMGKLAQVSGSSAKEINASLTDIFEAVKRVTEEVTKASEVAAAQAAETDKIISTLEEVVSWACELTEYVRELN